MIDPKSSHCIELSGIRYVLTDIEGTTTSVQFVYDTLFPYFRKHIHTLEQMQEREDVRMAFQETVNIAREQDGITLHTSSEIIDTLNRWSIEDKKITPLKTLQGILWREGYESGEIKGHVYPDVPPAFEYWKQQGKQMGVFSSGSVDAQKQLFGFSDSGDLTRYFSHYFDTTTGTKREPLTYCKIAEILKLTAGEILFLSDIVEELEAAREAGYQTIQLVRPGNTMQWPQAVETFKDISFG